MPVVNHNQYCEMLNKAKTKKYAFPAFNVTSMATVNAVLAGLAEQKSDGIIQVSTGGGSFASGQSVADMATGAIALANYVHFNDRFQKDILRTFLRSRKKGQMPFSSNILPSRTGRKVIPNSTQKSPFGRETILQQLPGLR